MNLPVEILLADADILVGYCDSDATVFKLASEHIGPVFVLREVLDEVHELCRLQTGSAQLRATAAGGRW